VTPDEETALARFHADYPQPGPCELAVVIAAFNEESNIGAVLADIPATVVGLRATVIVVDDGSTDRTADVARVHHALVGELGRNHGQGVALRLGYRLARDLGASYIATLDADGQYSPSDLPVVLAPLLAGQADFVTGSRRLGSSIAPTLARRIGTVIFAALASRLVGQHLTDTSNGLRAMRAEVTAAVTLRQPQYQAAELLLEVLASGYRLAEVPTVIHRRASGRSKKGPSLVYGYRYARVMAGTWRRTARRR